MIKRWKEKKSFSVKHVLLHNFNGCSNLWLKFSKASLLSVVFFLKVLIINDFYLIFYLFLDVFLLKLQIVHFCVIRLLIRWNYLLNLYLLIFTFLNGKLHTYIFSAIFIQVNMCFIWKLCKIFLNIFSVKLFR